MINNNKINDFCKLLIASYYEVTKQISTYLKPYRPIVKKM